MADASQPEFFGSFGRRALGIAALAAAFAYIVGFVVKPLVLPEYQYAGPFVLPVTGLAADARQRANDDASALLTVDPGGVTPTPGPFALARAGGSAPAARPTRTLSEETAAYEQSTWDLSTVQCAIDHGWEPYQVTTATANGVAVQLVYLRTRDLQKGKPRQGTC